MMTEANAVKIYDNEPREKQCISYLVAAAISIRKITKDVTGKDNGHDAEPQMLAALLAAEVVFLKSHWWKKDWPADAQETVALCVDCNDVFAWGCADAEGLAYNEIEDLFDHWQKDPTWGPAIWCMKKRNQMPQARVEKKIRAAGIWDLDEIKLTQNTQDAEVKAAFKTVK